ncbi:MAG: hypothetical protein ACJAYU_004325, partial [Bradymonadia bacterium]
MMQNTFSTRAAILVALLASAAIGCDSEASAANAAAVSAPIVMGGQVVEPEAVPSADGELAEAESQPTAATDGHDDQDEHGRPGPLEPGQTGHYGAQFAIDGDAISLHDAIATCAGTGTACKVTGTVDTVCQVSGCWFTIAAPDVESTVRIRMVDYGFFVPQNAVDAMVTFEGTLELLEVPAEVAQHYADDEAAAGGEARVVDGPELTYQFMITGAE